MNNAARPPMAAADPAKSRRPRALPPPSFGTVLRIMLWKNLTIKRRRKLELILMLFQIFIWFGWGAARFIFRGKYQFLSAIAPTRESAHIDMFQHMALPSNHPIALSLVEDPRWTPPELPKEGEWSLKDVAQGHPLIDAPYLDLAMHYFQESWSRTMGKPTLTFFSSNNTAAVGLREDRRQAFHIHFERLKLDEANVSIALSFWDKEIPLETALRGHNAACRPQNSKLVGGLTRLNPFDYHGCAAGKYFTSSFVLAEGTLLNSILRAKMDLDNNYNHEFVTDDKIRTNLQGKLEFPGVSVVTEDFPLHSALLSYFPDLAQGTPIFIMIAFARFLITSMYDLVAEKESKLKEVMKIFGLTTNQYWISWFITLLIMNSLYTMVTVIIAKMCNMFLNTSFVPITVFFYFYLLSLLTSGMLLSVFFEKAQSVTAIAYLINMLTHSVGWIMTVIHDYPFWVKVLACLLSPVTFSLGMDETVASLPMRVVTVSTWFDFDDHSMGFYSIMLVIDAIGYFLLAWYLDTVIPSTIGVAKPWHFPITAPLRYLRIMLGWTPITTEAFMPAGFENPPEGGNMEPISPLVASHGCAVRIRNLVKEFTVAGEKKRAVDDLSLDIYNSEIFALLGHNGAGKTTTISILTGMLAADGGEAYVNGYSLRNNPREVQQSISVCPQHNIFFDELFCIEHLCFFAALRGVDVQLALLKLQNSRMYAQEVMQDFQKRQNAERIMQVQGQRVQSERSETKTWDGIMEMIYRFGLTSKLFNHPRTLSGGQKRRLWLALALIAEPQVVFLDEPTSGVDPVGRQDIWKVIQEERRSGRCIILTTHHMEEADILADRKAVMAAGRVRCIGTSLFLKSRFGIGYYLEVQMERDHVQDEEAMEKLDSLVNQHTPEGHRVTAAEGMGTMAAVSASAGMLIYALPLSGIASFGPLLNDLERMKKDMHVRDYAMSMSTLEEVFFKLGEDQTEPEMTAAEPTAASINDFGKHGRSRSSSILQLTGEEEQPQTETSTIAGNLVDQKFAEIQDTAGKWQQLKGILYLRYAQVAHNKWHFFVDAVLPMVLFVGGLFSRSEGPGNIGDVLHRTVADHKLSDYNTYLNNSIPYMIDPQLSNMALRKVDAFLNNLPFKEKLLPLVPAMSLSALSEATPESIYAGLREGSKAAEEYFDQVYFDPEPTTTKDYLARRPVKIKDFSKQNELLPIDMAYVFNVEDMMSKTRPEGLFLRNFLWTTSSSDMFGTWSNFYPTALYIEPATKQLSDSNVLGFLEPDFDNVQLRVSWNPYALHSFPSLLNGVGHGIYGALYPQEADPSITIKSVPLYEDLPIFVTSLTWAMYTILSLVLSSLPQRFGSQVMFDRALKTKHTLIVMGCPFTIYWIGTFLMNWLVMGAANVVLTGAISWFMPMFTQHLWSLPVVLIGMILCSAALLTYGYFWTFIFQSGRSYNLFMNLSIMLLSLVPAYLVSVSHDTTIEVGGIPLPTISRFLHRVCSFTLAPYSAIGCLISCIMVMNRAHVEKREAQFEEFWHPSQGVVWSMLGAVFQCIVFGLVIVYMDAKQYSAKTPDRYAVQYLAQWKHTRNMVRQQAREAGKEELLPVEFQISKDEDVLFEEKVVDDIMTVLKAQEHAVAENEEIPLHFPMLNDKPPQQLPPIMIHNLHHVYLPTSSAADPTVAIKGLSLSVSGGEVLGLLGPNGAGKSTTINLLTCDSMLDAPSEGDGYLGGVSVTSDPQRAFPYIGMVPQFDALWPDVTVSDNLRTFANIKRIPKALRTEVINHLISSIGLQPHMHKRIKELSGGNKRRASVAVSFLGNPRVILMDEPSSGIDPAGRRKLLEMIQREAKNRAIIITTHSMEEAESLCTRVGIVVNGELQCLGTCLSIKNMYGAGLRLEIDLEADWKSTGRLQPEDKEKIVNFVDEKLARGSVLPQPRSSDRFSRLYTRMLNPWGLENTLFRSPRWTKFSFALLANKQLAMHHKLQQRIKRTTDRNDRTNSC